MATGKSGYLPTYNAGRMYVTPHYVEEYDAVGNYSRVKIDYIDFTSSHYEQGVNWDVAVSFKINGGDYSFSGDVTTHSYTAQRCACSIMSEPIYHNDDGSKSITVTMTYAWWANGTVGYRWEESGTLSASTIALTTIPRASELYASNGTLGVAQTLTVYKKADSHIHAITYKCGSEEGYIVSKVGHTSISWTPPLSLAGQNKTGLQVNVTLTIHTYIADGTWIAYREYPIVCTIPDSVGLTVSDGWATVQPYNNGTPASVVNAYVQGYSKAKVTFDASKISTANAYGAEIAGYHIVHEGVGSAENLTGVLRTAGDNKITCTVTDTRGRSISQTLCIRVQGYKKPVLSGVSVFRCNCYGENTDDGTYISVTASSNISSIGGLNGHSMRCEVGNLLSVPLQSGVTAVLGEGALLITSTYTVKVTLTDTLGNTAVYTGLVPTADVMFHARTGGNGAAFGKYSEEDDLLDVAWGTRLRKQLYLDGGLVAASPVAPRNLLDNSDFRKPVNQRGASGTIPTWTYLIDRWRTGSNPATISVNNGLVCTGYISQIIAPDCDGKTITFAAKINGEIFCCSAEINAVTAWTQFAQATTNVGGMGICKWDNNVMYVEIVNNSQGTIEWAALYEGRYTPETLPPYMPKGYVAEYVECRRYFRKYVVWQEGLTGYTNWEGIPRVLFYGEPAMRVNPTASVFKASLCIDGTTVSVNETPTKIANYNGMIAVFLGNLNNDNHETKAFGGYLNDVEFTLSADL